jgi:hypothetical protein
MHEKAFSNDVSHIAVKFAQQSLTRHSANARGVPSVVPHGCAAGFLWLVSHLLALYCIDETPRPENGQIVPMGQRFRNVLRLDVPIADITLFPYGQTKCCVPLRLIAKGL